MPSTDDLATETAQVLLSQIQQSASGMTPTSPTAPERLLQLAQAYSTVVESMPKPTSPPVRLPH